MVSKSSHKTKISDLAVAFRLKFFFGTHLPLTKSVVKKLKVERRPPSAALAPGPASFFLSFSISFILAA